uniref:Disease resistance protein Roq1-like winged-helix domain-containing protein n=1 Tax=Brassica oleracea var. oleracea TaxID=109376 RepID=A0A0D3EEF6_BRAOL
MRQTLVNSNNLDVNHGLHNLEQKSLISIDTEYGPYEYIKMHTLLQQMRRDIVKKKTKEIGKRQFLMDPRIFLNYLKMKILQLEKLWDGIKPLQRLWRMVLRESVYLKEIPDLTNATSLEELDLHECIHLLELTSTIGNATKLKRCILSSRGGPSCDLALSGSVLQQVVSEHRFWKKQWLQNLRSENSTAVTLCCGS